VFVELYERATEQAAEAENQESEETISLTASTMPVGEFLRIVAIQTGVSVVASAELDRQTITIEATNQPVSVVLGLVARRLGAQVSRTGSAYFIGELRAEDRGVLVRRVGRLTRDELQRAVDAMLSSEGDATVTNDGLIVAADRAEVLDRVQELLDGVEQASDGDWVLQLHLVALSDSLNEKLGLDIVPEGKAAATLAWSSGNPTGSSVSVDATLSAVLEATRTESSGGVIAEPVFLLRDGEEARLTDGDRVPIPQFTVSEGGTVSNSGIIYVDTGLIVDLSIREINLDKSIVAVSIELSEIVGFVDVYPRTRSRTFSTRAGIESSGVYLLGKLEASTKRHTLKSITRSATEMEDTQSTVQVWLSAYRVSNEKKQ